MRIKPQLRQVILASAIVGTAIGISTSALSQDARKAPSFVVGATKVAVSTTVRASLSAPPSDASQITVFAPLGTQVWRDETGCSVSSGGSAEIALAPDAFATPICWRGDRAQTARLVARADLASGQREWLTGESVEFYSNEWFDRSFVAGVLTTILGALIAGVATFAQQWSVERRERRMTKLEAEGKLLDTRIDIQRFLAERLFTALQTWRSSLDRWDLDRNNPPDHLDLSGSHGAIDKERLQQLKQYFSDLGKSSFVADIQELHTLANAYNKSANALSVAKPTDTVGQREFEENRTQAINAAKQIRALLKALLEY